MLCNNYKNNGSVLINRILLISEDKITSVKIHSYRFLNYKIDSHDNIEEKKEPQLFGCSSSIILLKFYAFSSFNVSVGWSQTSVGPKYWMGPG